jgi:hypothetical protein
MSMPVCCFTQAYKRFLLSLFTRANFLTKSDFLV